MKLDFVEGQFPLTKTLCGHPPALEQPVLTPKVTSHSEEVVGIAEFYRAICDHAAKYHALFSGCFRQPLEQESRRFQTDKTFAPEWVCLDLDRLPGFGSVESVLEKLNLSHVSHIVQYSASSGLQPDALSAHVFFLLDRPVAESERKLWLKHLNLAYLNRPEAPLRLTAEGTRLKYPLDVCLAELSRYIFIAPPILKDGAIDPLQGVPRILLNHRTQAVLSFSQHLGNVTFEQVLHDERQTIRQARQHAGYRPTLPATKLLSGTNIPYQPKPTPVTVTRWYDRRDAADPYLRFDVNGGDSRSYYVALNQPEVVRCFKYENATFKTSELLDSRAVETIYETARTFAEHSTPTSDPTREGFFAFLDLSNGRYTVINIAPDTGCVKNITTLPSKDALKDHCLQHNEEMPNPVPHWRLDFLPNDLTVVHDSKQVLERWINTYQPPLVRRQVKDGLPVTGSVDPALKLIRHILGNSDESTGHFLNWLAYIWQTGLRTQTPWVIHGTTGTGKDSFVSRLLVPLFGPQQVALYGPEAFNEKWNDFLLYKSFLVMNEIDTEVVDPKILMPKLRMWATDEQLPIRAMGKTFTNVKNYLNLIIFSNQNNVLELPWHERRVNVAPRQDLPLAPPATPGPSLFPTIEALATFLDQVSDEKNLHAFASFLQRLPVDETAVIKPLDNDARRTMQSVTSSTVDDFVRALLTGDFAYFVQFIPDKYGNDLKVGLPFKQLLDSIYEQLLKPPKHGVHHEINLSLDHLGTLYRATVSRKAEDLSKLKKTLQRHNATIKAKTLSCLPPPGDSDRRRRSQYGYQFLFRPADETLHCLYEDWWAASARPSVAAPPTTATLEQRQRMN